MARRKYVVGNWKMNGLSDAVPEAQAIFAAAAEHDGVTQEPQRGTPLPDGRGAGVRDRHP